MNNEVRVIELPVNTMNYNSDKASEIKKSIYENCKRFFDIYVALVGLILLVPIAIIIKIVYLFNRDNKSIFYKQKRIGKNGEEFDLYKFRTMIPNADEVLEKILREDKQMAEEYRINKKIKNDPRITKAGKFIRRSSLDELPQLINILKNDMSFIGNRPYLPKEKIDMGDAYDDIVKTKPGLTGYWQVSGRSDTTFKKRVELEKYYSNNYSLKMDIKIFINTFRVVILKKGAK